MNTKKLHVCDFRTIPIKGTECYEAIWSKGNSCKNCYRDNCYRQGWPKSKVDDDNKVLVLTEAKT